MPLALRQSISILTTVRHGLFADYNAAVFFWAVIRFYLLKSWRACGAESILRNF